MVELVDVKKFDELIGGDKPVVCDFYADWCMPCKMLASVVDDSSEKHAQQAVYVKVNVDESIELAARYGIMSIPFVGIFKGGQLAAKNVGFVSKSEFEEFITKNL